MNQPKSQPANIKVYCRFRPLNKFQINQGDTQKIHHKISDKCLHIKDKTKDNLTFVFDHIFDTQATQQDIYNEVGAPILSNILDGFNGTIIAYGQTSSGKTYTIQGCGAEAKNKGIIPRIVIYSTDVAIQNSNESIEYKLKVSILELYMEKLYDLIDTSKTDLKIRESKAEGNYVEHKTQVYISDKFELQRIINVAQKNRVTCVTNMNANSSRSHLIFQLTLNQFNSETSQAKTSNLFIVDLAGSEKVSKTGAQGKTLEQAKKINLSLTSLAKVIKSLSEKIPHVPYRDSKLTRIIQDSLGGNSKTSLVLTCSPHQINLHQTLSTLRFGQTAQKIKNKPKINREPTIQQLQNLIEKLQVRIKAKDRWIAALQMQLKNAGIGMPRVRQSHPSPRSPKSPRSPQKLFTTTDIYSLKDTLKDTMPPSFLSISVSPQFESLHSLQSQSLKNFGQSLQIPTLMYSKQSLQNSKCQTEQDQHIQNLQNLLATYKSSLQTEINKFYQLKKQYNCLHDNIKQVIQQNLQYQTKQKQLEDTIKKLQAIIQNKDVLHEISRTKLEKQNENTINEIKNKENITNIQIVRLKQENKELLTSTNNLKVQNQLLQLKIKSKENKIIELKQMLEEIHEQMELLEEEYDAPLNLNTKIANPIKRSVIFQ